MLASAFERVSVVTFAKPSSEAVTMINTTHNETGAGELTFIRILVQWIDVGALNNVRVANDSSSFVSCALSLCTTFKIGSSTCTEIV